MDFKIFAAELFNIFPNASLAQTLDLYSALRLVGTADPVAVARDDVVIRILDAIVEYAMDEFEKSR